MTKKSIFYSDLSKTQLQHLKEIYIQKKVDGMSHKELKEFVLEIISHQIKETIGKEEESEAWEEMADYFGEQFEIIVFEIQNKFKDNNNSQTTEENHQKERLELLEKNNLDQNKKDMWDD